MNKEARPRGRTRKYPKKEETSRSEDEEDDNSTIRCPCGDNTDKGGLMIQCETCLAWQHSICLGIREDKAVPPHYFCEICLPRNFKCLCGENKATGKFVQCTECSNWQHVRCLGKSPMQLGKSYRCPFCAPDDFKKTSKLKEPRKPLQLKPTKSFDFISSISLREVLEYEVSNLSQVKENFEKGDQQSLLPSKQEVMEKYCIMYCDSLKDKKVECQELVKGLSILLECPLETIKEWSEEIFQELSEGKVEEKEIVDPMEGWSSISESINLIPDDVEIPPLKVDDEGGVWDGKDMSEILEITKVSPSRWNLSVTQPLQPHDFIIEYLGKITLLKDNEYQQLPAYDKLFVLRTHQIVNNSCVCFDSRTCGNKSRYIRRSCKPNAFVKYQIQSKNGLRAGIFVNENSISSRNEITIGFDSNWKESKDVLQCACSSGQCQVEEWFKNRQVRAKAALVDMKAISLRDSDSEEEVKRKKRGRKPKSEQATTTALTDSKKAENSEASPSTPLKKMSREERKIALLMKSFQKLENRQNRKRKHFDGEPSRRGRKPMLRRKRVTHDEDWKDEDSESEGDKDSPEPEEEKPKPKKSVKKEDIQVTMEPKVELESPTISASELGVEKKETILELPNGVLEKEPEVKDFKELEKKEIEKDIEKKESEREQPEKKEQEPEKEPTPSLTSPSSSSRKFGKKAWIRDFQEHFKEESKVESVNVDSIKVEPVKSLEESKPTLEESRLPSPREKQDDSVFSKFPVKKKMLGSFLTDQDSQCKLYEKESTYKPADSSPRSANVSPHHTDEVKRENQNGAPNSPSRNQEYNQRKSPEIDDKKTNQVIREDKQPVNNKPIHSQTPRNPLPFQSYPQHFGFGMMAPQQRYGNQYGGPMNPHPYPPVPHPYIHQPMYGDNSTSHYYYPRTEDYKSSVENYRRKEEPLPPSHSPYVGQTPPLPSSAETDHDMDIDEEDSQNNILFISPTHYKQPSTTPPHHTQNYPSPRYPPHPTQPNYFNNMIPPPNAYPNPLPYQGAQYPPRS